MLIWLFAPPFQDFCAKDYGSWERMVSMNILGYLFTIGEFLPEMRARGSGHLVNISSDSERAAWPGEAAGHVCTPSFPAPGFTVYTGTKFFWAGASEALRKELTGSGVGRGDHVDCEADQHPAWLRLDGRPQGWLLEGSDEMLPGDTEVQKEKMLRPEDVADCLTMFMSMMFLSELLFSKVFKGA